MSTRTLAIWTAAIGLVAATGVKTAQAAPCPTSGNIPNDCDTPGLSVVIDDGTIVSCPGTCTVSATAAAQKFYSLHDRSAYDFLIICPVFNTSDGARNFLVDTGDGVIRGGTEQDVTGLGPGIPSTHLRGMYGANAHLQSYIQMPNCMGLPADDNARLPVADPNGYHSAMSMLAEQMGHRWGAYANIPGASPTALITSPPKNWQFYTNSASTCPSAAPAGTLCASSLWGNNWTGSGPFSTNSRTDGFSPLDQYFMGLRDAEAVLPFFYLTGGSGGPSSNSAPHREGAAVVNVSGATSHTVTIDDIKTQNGVRTPLAAVSPKTFNQAVILLAQQGVANQPTQAMVTRIEQLRQSWVKYFGETTDHNGQVDTRVKKRPVDVLFLLDLSGSFSDDLPVLQANFQALLDDLVATTSAGSQFGVASFVDFPFPPHGNPGDYTYKVDLPLTTNTTQVVNTVAGLTTYDGNDLPQNQYEALYQAITGEGLDLDNDGVYTSPGEIPPVGIGHFDPNVPLFILLFTDATFHNPDTELDYPTTAFHGRVHGRNAVLSRLVPPSPFSTAATVAPTPKNYVFGMVPGLGLPPPDGILEIPELTELASLTGGNVFPLSHDSAGVTAAVEQAVEDTNVPVLSPPKVLQKVAVRAATVHWNHDHDCDKGLDKDSLVLEQGTVDLPDGTGFSNVGMHSKVALAAGAGLSLVADDVDFISANTRIGTVWHFGDMNKGLGVVEYDILWTSPTHGEFLIAAKFDSATRNLNGNLRPASLTTMVSLGTGADALSGDASVQGTQWKVLNQRHWQSKILMPLTAAASAQVAEEGQVLAIGFDAEASDTATESNGCAVVGRRVGAYGNSGLAAIALVAVSAVLRRRKRASGSASPS